MSAISKSNRTGEWKVFGVFAIWALVYVAARGLLELESLGWWPRSVVALAPVPVFALVLWNLAKAVTGMDELERRIQLEALAFAFPMTLLLIMTLGLLEIAKGLNRDDWIYRHVWPMFFILSFAGLARAKRRYE